MFNFLIKILTHESVMGIVKKCVNLMNMEYMFDYPFQDHQSLNRVANLLFLSFQTEVMGDCS